MRALSEDDASSADYHHHFDILRSDVSNDSSSPSERRALARHVYELAEHAYHDTERMHEHRRQHHRRHYQTHESSEDSHQDSHEDGVVPKTHAPGAHKDSKPKSETHVPRHHHHRHHTLEADEVPFLGDMEQYNDLNFDVNKDMRIHMKTDDNYRDRDIKFDVHLPHDLIDHQHHDQL